MNEVVPRSRTRGQAPEARFNRRNCHRVHADCHREVTENRLRLAFLDPARGVDGGLVVQSSLTEVAVVYRRNPPRLASLGPGRAWRRIWTPAEEGA